MQGAFQKQTRKTHLMNISIQAKIFIYLFFIVSKSKRRQDIIYLSSM